MESYLTAKPTLADLDETLQQDFQTLRSKGLESIKTLTGKEWTDFYVTDPGVMTLELLCLSLVEIGARTQYPIKDLLAVDPDAHNEDDQIFFPAQAILPTNPVTLVDLRKLLLDHPDVRNAWVKPARNAEHLITFNTEQKKLNYGNGPNIVAINGLYSVEVELDESTLIEGYEAYKGLENPNHNIITWSVDIDGKAILLETSCPFMDALSSHWRSDNDFEAATVVIKSVPNPDTYHEDFLATIGVSWTGIQELDELPVQVKIITPDTSEGVDETLRDTVKQYLQDALPSIAQGGFLKAFRQKVKNTQSTLINIEKYLHAHRNLSEDFLAVKIVHAQEIGVTANIEVHIDTDIETLLAEIYQQLDIALDPKVTRHSLEALLEAEGSLDSLLEGPLPQNGLLEKEEIETIENKKVIYISDLIGLLINSNEAIMAIEHFRLTNYIDNQPYNRNDDAIFELTNPDQYRPLLSINKSSIRFYQNGVELKFDLESVKDKFNALKKLRQQEQLDVATSINVSAAKGEYRNPGKYLSLQERFLPVYGIGSERLPHSASDFRKTQAKQFKGYLTFFDQILANATAHIAQLRNRLSVNSQWDQTYSFQPLYDIPDIKDLLVDFQKLEKDEHSWETFKEDLNNLYLQKLKEASENRSTFLDRSNRLLDHLLARFAEQYIDPYRLLDKRKNGSENDVESEQERLQERINHKADLLRNYSFISHNRFRAFNILGSNQQEEPDVWDTDNITGFERRVAYLLGISDFKRRQLHHPDLENDISDPAEATEGFHLVEHILLRPRICEQGAVDSLLTLETIENTKTVINDPYSFKISLFFPDWPKRFAQKAFRAYAEALILEEAPAHLAIDIHWLSNTQMRQFEQYYLSWLLEMNRGNPLYLDTTERVNRVNAHNNLIRFINTFLEEQYPELYSNQVIDSKTFMLSDWDYRDLILKHFSLVREARILNRTTQSAEREYEGDLRIVVVPYSNQQSGSHSNNAVSDLASTAGTPSQPELSSEELQAIADFIKGYVPENIAVEVINPLYTQVIVNAEVVFSENDGNDDYKKKLSDDLRDFIYPWAYDDAITIDFDQVIETQSIKTFIEQLPYVVTVNKVLIGEHISNHPTPGIGHMMLENDFILFNDPIIYTETIQAKNDDTILISTQTHIIRDLDDHQMISNASTNN